MWGLRSLTMHHSIWVQRLGRGFGLDILRRLTYQGILAAGRAHQGKCDTHVPAITKHVHSCMSCVNAPNNEVLQNTHPPHIPCCSSLIAILANLFVFYPVSRLLEMSSVS